MIVPINEELICWRTRCRELFDSGGGRRLYLADHSFIVSFSSSFTANGTSVYNIALCTMLSYWGMDKLSDKAVYRAGKVIMPLLTILFNHCLSSVLVYFLRLGRNTLALFYGSLLHKKWVSDCLAVYVCWHFFLFGPIIYKIFSCDVPAFPFVIPSIYTKLNGAISCM